MDRYRLQPETFIRLGAGPQPLHCRNGIVAPRPSINSE